MNHAATSVDRLALSATIHCLTGCAIGEVLGLVIATALGWHDLPSVLLAIVLAFVFGYALTIRPLLASGMRVPPGRAAGDRVGHPVDHDHGDRRHRDRPC